LIILCRNMKKTWQNEHGITIAKYRNSIIQYILPIIGTLTINDKEKSMRTRKS
jgi:hypothetical protein